MKRFKVDAFTKELADWTRSFCRASEWKTRPNHLADDLFQECYCRWERVCATYSEKPYEDKVRLFKRSCGNMILDIAAKVTVRKTVSTDDEHYAEPVRLEFQDDGGLRDHQLLSEFIQFVRTTVSTKRECEYTVHEMVCAVRERFSGKGSSESERMVLTLASRIGEDRIRQFLAGV